MELSEVISARRSVREYLDSPLSEDKIEKLLEAARWAPSWANTQCVRYVVIRDTEIKKDLKETLTPSNPARPSFDTCPVILAVVAKLGVAGCKKGVAVDDKQWHMFDSALSVQNISLSAAALGLGTVIVGAFDYKKADSILSVSEGFQTVAFLPLGYPKSAPSAPPRKPLAEITFKEKFGQS
ncbi:MAG: nitroreductase family protein [Planctomycetota bacterium]